jgi:hypothetical protein
VPVALVDRPPPPPNQGVCSAPLGMSCSDRPNSQGHARRARPRVRSGARWLRAASPPPPIDMQVIPIPIIQNDPIVDPKQRTAATGRGAHMKHVAPHEISGPKSARPHGGIPSPGAEQRRGQWVVSGQEFTYGWIGQQPGSGLSDRPPATLGQIHFLDRF